MSGVAKNPGEFQEELPTVADSAPPQRTWPARGEPLGRSERAAFAILGGGALALLLTAAALRPDPAGHGTHRQLGLPPCTLLLYTGYPCPSCGMTTSWSHLTRGDLSAAVRANFGGTLLALCAGLFGVWAVLQAAAGRRLPLPRDGVLVGGAAFVLVFVLVDYGVRLHGWRPEPPAVRFASEFRKPG